MRKEIVGKILNTIEHALPFPLKDVVYFFICRLPEPFYSGECWLCKRRKVNEIGSI